MGVDTTMVPAATAAVKGGIEREKKQDARKREMKQKRQKASPEENPKNQTHVG